MSNKEAAMEVIRNLPDDASIDEILGEIQILSAIYQGLEAADRGQVVPHEEAKRRVESWLSKSNGPTPLSTTSERPSNT